MVLPQPDGPSRQKNSRSKMSSVRSSTAAVAPKRLVTLSKRIRGTAPGSVHGAKERRADPTGERRGNDGAFEPEGVGQGEHDARLEANQAGGNAAVRRLRTQALHPVVLPHRLGDAPLEDVRALQDQGAAGALDQPLLRHRRELARDLLAAAADAGGEHVVIGRRRDDTLVPGRRARGTDRRSSSE